jgi:hypothetical protein
MEAYDTFPKIELFFVIWSPLISDKNFSYMWGPLISFLTEDRGAALSAMAAHEDPTET